MNIAYKFRVFDRIDKEYKYFDFNDTESIGWVQELGSINELLIQQSTSCFDKNGTLIFQGDLIRTDDEKVYEVVRYFGGFVIFKDFVDSKDRFTVYLDDFTTKQYEKVGNISENSELLIEETNQATLEKINVI